MPKLLRLSTENTNCTFIANFDTDIKLKENAKIALKNISFESLFDVINMNARNGDITVQPISADGLSVNRLQKLRSRNYSKNNFNDFLFDVENTLNRTCSLSNGFDSASGEFVSKSEVCSSFSLDIDREHVRISLLLSPLLPIFETGPSGEAYWEQNDSPNDAIQEVVDSESDLLQLDPNISIGENNDSMRAYPRFPIGLSKGSGMFYAQTHTLVRAVGQPAYNGFKMGITFEPLTTEAGALDLDDAKSRSPRAGIANHVDTISNAALHLQIIVSDRNDGTFRYEYISRGYESAKDGAAPTIADSGVNVKNHGGQASETKNDIIMFKIDTESATQRKVIKGVVLQDNNDGTSSELTLFTYNLQPTDLNKTFTPYLCILGSRDRTKVGNCRFSADPHVNTDLNQELTYPNDEAGLFPLEDNHPIQDICSAPLKKLIPIINDNRFEDGLTTKITIDNYLIGKLGSSSTEIGAISKILSDGITLNLDPLLIGKNFVGLKPYTTKGISFRFPELPDFEFKDFYILEMLNMNLDSFDSSETVGQTARNNNNNQTTGSRKNILATIPISNGDNAMIQFEPAELFYIDIRNSENLNLRNIRCRVVDENFDEIKVLGKSNVTLSLDN